MSARFADDESFINMALLVSSVFLYWKYPMSRYWVYTLVVLALVVFKNTSLRKKVERFASFVANDLMDAKNDLMGPAKQAKPVVTVPAIEEDMKLRREAAAQEVGDRKEKNLASKVQLELYDKNQAAEQILTNVREFDTPRAAIVPSEDEQIFGSRPSVRDMDDGYRTMFSGIPNNSMKYLSKEV